MNYQEAVAWLYSTQEVGIKLGLESVRTVLRALELDDLLAPRSGGPILFHIAGTNGKGSVCAMLDALCREAGYTTGLFTSPHLVTYRERLRLNGRMIPEEEVATLLNRIRTLVEARGMTPTFFEITTALALAWFRQSGAEVMILETGLGGRLDSTNAVTPNVSILTPISLDHHQYLGDTLSAIAAEKAGIIKPRCPVVSARQPAAAAAVIVETSQRLAAPLSWSLEPVDFPVALAGSHQKLNASLALAALAAAGVELDRAAQERAFSVVSWPGRFQRIAGEPEIILDGAHNEAAAERLVTTWRETFGDEQPVILFGALADKDIAAICRSFAPLGDDFVITPVRNLRSCEPAALAATLASVHPQVRCTTATSFEEALAAAQTMAAASGRRIVITGSFFLIGQALAYLDGEPLEQVSSQ